MNNPIRVSVLAASVAAVLSLATSGVATAQAPKEASQRPAAKPATRSGIERSTIDRIIAGWAARPQLGAQQMMEKYGSPQEASGMTLVWHDAGPFKRIKVMNLETPHDFPLPHVDFMEHTISYNVPADKLADLLVFDGSSTINRTTGELSARCDLEGHNVLTLNLDHDIVTGKKSVADARKAFGDLVQQEMMGKRPAYIEALQFEPGNAAAARFSDEPVIPGSPLRAADVKGRPTADSEVLATVAMIDRNEIVAAMQAQQKKLSQPVRDHARMLHQQHGMNFSQTLKVGQQIEVTPMITAEVDELSKQGAAILVPLMPLDGAPFERGYIDAMVRGHTDALAKIDNELLKAANDEAVKSHLTKTRAVVVEHLAQAKALQGKR